MKKIKRNRVSSWLVFLGLAVLATEQKPLTMFAQDGTQLVMVVNKANDATITKALAKRLLLGQQTTWSDGKKVLVALRPAQNPDRVELLKKICSMSESEYTRYEMQVAFTGQTPAKVLEEGSSAAMKLFVKSNPGAVGFLHKSEVDADLKIALMID
jgi:ABC-type phosphate transport system substrate-binding protein